MTISLDQITRKKLVLVKQMYRRSSLLSSKQHSPIDRIMAVIGFDLCVETILNAAFSSLEPHNTPPDSFQSLVSKVDNLLTEQNMSVIPDKAHIQHVHSIRNDTQHKAKYPNDSDVSDCRIYVRDFLKIFVNDIWSIDFEKISLSDLIKNQKIKKYLLDAEENFRNGDLQKTVENAAIGLQSAINSASTPFVGRSAIWELLTNSIVVTDHFKEMTGNRDVTSAFKKMQQTLQDVALGLDHSDYIRFRQITGPIIFTGGGPRVDRIKKDLDENDTEFILSYSVDAVLQIEGRVGDIEKLFGQEWWS